MKRFLRTALALSLALACALASAASAEETGIDEFLNGPHGYHTILRTSLISMGMPDEYLDDAVKDFTYNYDAAATEYIGSPTYSTNLKSAITFENPDDPCSAIFVILPTQNKEEVPVYVGPFALFFSAYVGGRALDELVPIVNWFCENYASEPETDYRGYHLHYFGRTEGSVGVTSYQITRN